MDHMKYKVTYTPIVNKNYYQLLIKKYLRNVSIRVFIIKLIDL